MASYKYIVYQDAPQGACDYPRLEEFFNRKDADRYMKSCDAEDRQKGRACKPWRVDKFPVRHQYYVEWQHAHGSQPSTLHGRRVFAYNAKEACRIVLDKYYDDLDALYYRRGTCKNAAAHGIRYPFHLQAERMD